MKRKCIAAVLVSLVLLSGCAFLPETNLPAEDTVQPPAAIPGSGTKQAVEGSPADDPVYDQMCSALRAFQSSVKIEGGVSGEMLDVAFYRIGRENPELFWVTGYSAEYNDISANVEFKTIDGVTDPGAMAEKLNNAADSLARQAKMFPSDYDRVLLVHDHIVEHTVYDNAGAAADTSGIWSTAYGCLVNGSATCQGYAEAFLLVMNKLDIPAGIVSGTTAEGPHSWNYVYVNGAYYWVDVTWDDPIAGNGENALRHTYFLINDDLLLRSRTIGTEQGGFVPECKSLDANYFVRNGNYLTGYRFTDIDMRLSAANGSIEVMFDSESSLNAAIQALFTDGEIWNAMILREKSATVQYGTDEKQCVLRIMIVYD